MLQSGGESWYGATLNKLKTKKSMGPKDAATAREGERRPARELPRPQRPASILIGDHGQLQAAGEWRRKITSTSYNDSNNIWAVVGAEYCAPRAIELEVVVVQLPHELRPESSSLGPHLHMEFRGSSNDSMAGGGRTTRSGAADRDRGQLIFRAPGHTRAQMAAGGPIKRVLTDASGVPIACAQKKMFSIFNQWNGHHGNECTNENRLFKVKKSNIFQQETSYNVFLTTKPQLQMNEPDVKVVGSYDEMSYNFIHKDGNIIAQVTPSKRFISPFKKSFCLTIYAGIDTAFIALLTVILEEVHQKPKKES